MPVRRIIRMGHPHLRQAAKALPLDELNSAWLDSLLTDMEDTLHDYGGVGLAAPQINEPWRLAIIEINGAPGRYGQLESMPLTAFINPSIEVLTPTPTVGFWEGCLSIPGLRGYVERPQHIAVNYRDLAGATQRLELHGFHATVFQHEFDHLDGKLYVDRVKDPALLMFEEELSRHNATWQEHPLVQSDAPELD